MDGQDQADDGDGDGDEMGEEGQDEADINQDENVNDEDIEQNQESYIDAQVDFDSIDLRICGDLSKLKIYIQGGYISKYLIELFLKFYFIYS